MAKLLLMTKHKMILFYSQFLEVAMAMQCNDWNWVRLINASLDKWFLTFINEDDI